MPLFLDSIFVMAVLFGHGLFPALGTFIVHYIIVVVRLLILHESVLPCFYAIPGIFIVLVTWLFTRKKENLQKSVNFTFIYILLASLCASLASCVAGGIVNFCIDSYVIHPEGWVPILDSVKENNMPVILSLIWGRIPITTLDRIVTTFAGFGLYKLCDFILKKVHNKGEN